jgi:hypothetical protein
VLLLDAVEAPLDLGLVLGVPARGDAVASPALVHALLGTGRVDAD